MDLNCGWTSRPANSLRTLRSYRIRENQQDASEMSKLGCKCGHVIRDQTERIPYKACLLASVDYRRFFDKLSREIQVYIEAFESQNLEEWMERHFNKCYPRNLGHGDILHDLLSSQFIERSLDVYQCDACGRIWIQKDQISNEFESFSPDHDGGRDLLRSNSSRSEEN